MRIKPRIFVGLVGSIIVLNLFLFACGPNQTPAETTMTYIPPEKGNPKLDSQLNQLVAAQAKGEVTAYAQKMNINLNDGRIRVVIECVPGQIEVASKAAVSSGAVVETTYENLIQVLIPVANLTALAKNESIKFVRLPQQPVPGSNK